MRGSIIGGLTAGATGSTPRALHMVVRQTFFGFRESFAAKSMDKTLKVGKIKS
jgi:hypothetical protein